jgi:hypothetical protein
VCVCVCARARACVAVCIMLRIYLIGCYNARILDPPVTMTAFVVYCNCVPSLSYTDPRIRSYEININWKSSINKTALCGTMLVTVGVFIGIVYNVICNWKQRRITAAVDGDSGNCTHAMTTGCRFLTFNSY